MGKTITIPDMPAGFYWHMGNYDDDTGGPWASVYVETDTFDLGAFTCTNDDPQAAIDRAFAEASAALSDAVEEVLRENGGTDAL
jgi:hypothetical protein